MDPQPRYIPTVATAQRFSELNRGAEIVWEKLDRALLRPRYSGYLYFQDRAGTLIRDYLRVGGGEQELLANLDELCRELQGRTAHETA